MFLCPGKLHLPIAPPVSRVRRPRLYQKSSKHKQGQYLAFIDNYMAMYGRAPAEADLQRFFGTTPPTIHQMVVKLEEKGLISRIPGQARSIKLLIDPDEIPKLKKKK